MAHNTHVGLGDGHPSPLSRLDDNILLIHLAPHLGVYGSLRLAATNTYYRNLLLHHTMGHNIIPSGSHLMSSFEPDALGVIRNIHIKPNTSDHDVISIMWGGDLLVSLEALTIDSTFRTPNLLVAGELGMQRLHALTMECCTTSEFLTNLSSPGAMHMLGKLTIEHTCADDHECEWDQPGNLVHALGPASQLTSLAISSDNAGYSHYHDKVLALLAALAHPDCAPPNLSLLSLSFPMERHSGSADSSIIVSARKSSLTHPKSAWSLGRIPDANSTRTEKIWDYAGYFQLADAELDAIIALDDTFPDPTRLTDFFAGPVMVRGTALAQASRFGTAIRGIEFDLSLPKIASPMLYHSLERIVLKFPDSHPVSVDPTPWLHAAAPNLKSLDLRTTDRLSHIPFAGPRVHELFALPAMPHLTTLQIDIRLLTVGNHQNCGSTEQSHPASRYKFGWIPAVSMLRLDNWKGCSACWMDREGETLRHYDSTMAGRPRVVTIVGEFYLLPEEEEEQFGKMWNVTLRRGLN